MYIIYIQLLLHYYIIMNFLSTQCLNLITLSLIHGILNDLETYNLDPFNKIIIVCVFILTCYKFPE
jgi:hypothetical protein